MRQADAVIIDSHAHFDPRMLEADAVLAKMDAAGVDRVAVIPPMNDPLPATPERLLSVVRVLMTRGITRPLAQALHRLTLTRGGDLRLGRKVYAIYPHPDNEGVARLVAAHPSRFLAWIFVNPKLPGALDELDRWRQVRGFIGVKLHPHWHDYTTEELTPILARAEELKLPALIHLGFGKRGDFRDLCRRFPRLTVISAHAGFPFYRDLWRHAPDHPNLFVDLSSPYIDERLARAAVAAMGPERCLYGTDAPYGFHTDDGYDYGRIKGWVERLPIASGGKDAIFGENFAGILASAGLTV